MHCDNILTHSRHTAVEIDHPPSLSSCDTQNTNQSSADDFPTQIYDVPMSDSNKKQFRLRSQSLGVAAAQLRGTPRFGCTKPGRDDSKSCRTPFATRKIRISRVLRICQSTYTTCHGRIHMSSNFDRGLCHLASPLRRSEEPHDSNGRNLHGTIKVLRTPFATRKIRISRVLRICQSTYTTCHVSDSNEQQIRPRSQSLGVAVAQISGTPRVWMDDTFFNE